MQASGGNNGKIDGIFDGANNNLLLLMRIDLIFFGNFQWRCFNYCVV